MHRVLQYVCCLHVSMWSLTVSTRNTSMLVIPSWQGYKTFFTDKLLFKQTVYCKGPLYLLLSLGYFWHHHHSLYYPWKIPKDSKRWCFMYLLISNSSSNQKCPTLKLFAGFYKRQLFFFFLNKIYVCVCVFPYWEKPTSCSYVYLA